MPLYEYACTGCDKRFDRLVSIADADAQPCLSCGSVKVRRLISVIAGVGGSSQMESSQPTGPTCGAGACGNCS